MDNRRRYYKLIENYINKKNKSNFEEFYGAGSHFSIKSITFGITNQTILIDCVITLGDVINEDVLNDSMIQALIVEIVTFIYPKLKIQIVVGWDS